MGQTYKCCIHLQSCILKVLSSQRHAKRFTSYFFPVSPITECDEDLVVDSNQKSEDDEQDIDRDIGNKDLKSIGFEDGGPENDDLEGKGSENAEI